jgi:hypothetical protein
MVELIRADDEDICMRLPTLRVRLINPDVKEVRQVDTLFDIYIYVTFTQLHATLTEVFCFFLNFICIMKVM